MPKYKVSVDLTHTFYQSETYECEVEAVNESEAQLAGERLALKHCDPNSWDAEFEDTEINGGEVKMVEGSDIESPYRCGKTSDMFDIVSCSNCLIVRSAKLDKCPKCGAGGSCPSS